MHPNKTLIYRRYTPHMPVPGEHLAVESRPFDQDAEPPVGGITIKNMYLSLDPYMRGQMRDQDLTATYSIPWVESEPAVVTTLSTVLKSDHPILRPGDLVFAMADAGEYAAVPAELAAIARKIETPSPNVAPSALVGALGVAGLSAYVSFFEFVPEPRKGKTLFVSAASGGVGQIIGQLAKMHEMKVIGSTGSEEKANYVTEELGFDAAWNYKTETTKEALSKLAPEGLDVYYDNAGGEQLETALLHMKNYGVVVMSGMMSQYNKSFEDTYGVRTLMQVVFKRLRLFGFICSDPCMVEKYIVCFEQDMSRWLAEGTIKTKEEVIDGIENAPRALVQMLQGDKFGKMVVKTSVE
ncbi:NAD(P)-binding protein [Xylariaceae sp. FL0255]|nr:NAD(P)-binding protein [Xylariaceae sp. FL0255]